MKKKVTKNKNLTSFADHLDKPHGERGTKKRETYEQEFEAFKIGALIHEMRQKQNLTQQQHAKKCGTTKSYFSRIENNASDIRLSTLMCIADEGLEYLKIICSILIKKLNGLSIQHLQDQYKG